MPEQVLIIGAGTMGWGIAQVFAQAGHAVVLEDVDPDALEKGLAGMRKSLAKLHEKGRIDEPADVVAARVHTQSTASDHAPGVGVAIEAVFENMELKKKVLDALEARLEPGALLATNTSGIPIGELAGVLERPERFLGLHFFNPSVLMRIVEVVKGSLTSGQAFDEAVGLVESLGKEPVQVKRDIPGFVLNRISMVASNEAIRLVEQGVASVADIDRGIKGAFGWRMGPLETADLVGLDVLLAARGQIFELTGDERFEPPELVRKLVAEGKTGRKAGAGFYEYDS